MSADKCKHGVNYVEECRDCEDDERDGCEHSFAAPPGSLALVRYCRRHEWMADRNDHEVVGRGFFAEMQCSGCGKVRPMVVFAIKRIVLENDKLSDAGTQASK